MSNYVDEDVRPTHEYQPLGMQHHSRFGVPVNTSIRGFKVKSWLPPEVSGASIRGWLLDNEPFNLLLDELTDPYGPYFVIKFIELQADMVIIHMDDDCVAIYQLTELSQEEKERVELGGPDTVRATDGAPGTGSVESSREDTSTC
jgi:hypothetical protein